MAGDSHSKTIDSGEKSAPWLQTGGLSKWLFFSLIFHSAFLLVLILSPYFPSATRLAPPIYTVDLVGGEKIGGNRPGTELYPSSGSNDSPKQVRSEPATPVREVKQAAPKLKEKSEKTLKPEKSSKPEANEKPEKVEKTVKSSPKTAPVEEKLAARNTALKKEEAKNEPQTEAKETKSTAAPEQGSLDKVRERLIQSALERVKSRAETTQKAAVASKGGEVLSVGPGDGDGAAALGQGGRGGGTAVKGAEFIMYQTKIVSTIKENWAWPGQKGSLKALVRFGIKDNGEITGMKIAEPSGDPAFDESILRALRKSSPLPPPPEAYRKDFAQVEMNFQL
jgi:colicin import membrane protein